jgi:putative AdoMet-dependent methyltransferase
MGREFDRLFDEWAAVYDDTVRGSDEEYQQVFSGYEKILSAVADKVGGTVLEFGVGTGNLTMRLLQKGAKVIGIEPSTNMRKLAMKKVKGNFRLFDGDFLDFPIPAEKVDAIVSSYAFHHLTDGEKRLAVEKYAALLKPGGKIVFADTMFPSEEDKQKAIREAEENGFFRLAEDLKTEYYTTIPFLTSVFEGNGFRVRFMRMNPYVWILEGEKAGGNG